MTLLSFALSLPVLIFLLLILKPKKLTAILVPLAIIYIFISDLFVSQIITFPLKFQSEHTFLATREISDAIYANQQQALYLPYKLRLIFFNNLIYIYYIFAHAFSFFSISNLNNVLLLANLYPLILGFQSFLSNHTKLQNSFFYGSLLITFLFLGISRSLNETDLFVIVSPLIVYLIILGLKKVKLKLYLALLVINLLVWIKTY